MSCKLLGLVLRVWCVPYFLQLEFVVNFAYNEVENLTSSLAMTGVAINGSRATLLTFLQVMKSILSSSCVMDIVSRHATVLLSCYGINCATFLMVLWFWLSGSRVIKCLHSPQVTTFCQVEVFLGCSPLASC